MTYMWNFGSILGLMLGVQIVTGLVMSMHFDAGLNTAYSSVMHINFDVFSGYLVRFLHANGATMFFISIYLHIARGIYYKSFHKAPLAWLSGVTMLFVFMGVAFLGYVLPWGQMSYWGATVITNLVSAIPYLGFSLVEWIWGGFSVGGPTLSRFYTLHFILPIMGAGLAIAHLVFLHETGSSNPLGLMKHTDSVAFHPFFTIKDLLGFSFLMIILMYLTCHAPLAFMDSDNFIEANPLVTPAHIQPEWYFLFAYAILRSVPNKLGGVMGLVMSIAVMYFLPVIAKDSSCMSLKHKLSTMVFFLSFMMLTFLGAMPVEQPFTLMSVLFSMTYFSSVVGIMM